MSITEAPQPNLTRLIPNSVTGATPVAPHRLARIGVLSELEHPSHLFGNLTPNWFASIMGTGIVAVAAASMPEQFLGLHTFAVTVWAAAALLLIALTAEHWGRHTATALSHANNPVMAHFYGAPPMAMMTVGAGTILLGKDVLGLRVAVDIDWVLWSVGTLTGLAAAAIVPYLMFTRHTITASSAFGGWLMPVVPPIPLGQSITAANLLGAVAHEALPAPYSTALQAFGVVYGVPVFGFALLWAVLAGAITIRTVREGLPFSLTWWSFTFERELGEQPVAVVVHPHLRSRETSRRHGVAEPERRCGVNAVAGQGQPRPNALGIPVVGLADLGLDPGLTQRDSDRGPCNTCPDDQRFHAVQPPLAANTPHIFRSIERMIRVRWSGVN